MQHIFIINPTAGKVDASVALIPQIHAAASRAGIKPIIEVTRRAGQARDLAAKYAASTKNALIRIKQMPPRQARRGHRSLYRPPRP